MAVRVTNLTSGDSVTYSLPLLAGEVAPPMSQGSASIHNHSNGSSSTWPIVHGRFKALVPLKPGENHIQIKFHDETLDFYLHYSIPAFPKFVRPVYITCADSDGHYQGPAEEDCSPPNACRRIAVAAKLLQTCTAEKLSEQGLGRRTFVLESDLDPDQPGCHSFQSELRLQDVYSMSGSDLWMHFAKELMACKRFSRKENCKWLAFMSFTRYEPPAGNIPRSHSEIISHTKGHTALGGGGLALYGSGTLHCWAEDVDHVAARFTDSRKMDRTRLMDDSAYREYYWANFSTGVGACLHELGHTFDLAHTPTGFMARGFDDIYRVFVVPQRAYRWSTSSSESGGLSSPVPYSPKQSPVHKPKTRRPSCGSTSRPTSPKPCPGVSRTRPLSTSGVPNLIQVETAFQKMHLRPTSRQTMRHYDGSETRKTVTRHPDGTETITEVTSYPNGDQALREVVQHTPSGKSRTTMSLGTTVALSNLGNGAGRTRRRTLSGGSDRAPDSPHLHHRHHRRQASHPSHDPSHLPKSPEGGSTAQPADCAASALELQQLRYKDGGAHWYRSSAVLLRFHKWFNKPSALDPCKPPTLDKNMIEAYSGIRLVELRSSPEGVVFHHWEFLHERPPLHFRLRHEEIRALSRDAKEIVILTEDDFGNMLKRKVSVDSLNTSRGADKSTS